MPDTRHRYGVIAENAARAFLRGIGCTILSNNFRTRYGEIDIIAKHQDLVLFVEVRSRARRNFISPAESVNLAKQRKLVLSAREWVGQADGDAPCRFDVIDVQIVNGLARIVDHIEGAFEPGDCED